MTTSRHMALDAFLDGAGWGDAEWVPLAGDASLRRYVRLRRDGARAVVMDAPPGSGEDVRPFVAIAEWLTARGLSAPDLLARDLDAGFLLLEDLGDDLLARHAGARPAEEGHLYAAAGALLADLQAPPPPHDLPNYNSQMPELAATVVDWYAPDARDRRDAIRARVAEAMDGILDGPPTLVHRDYHGENLLWLPDRSGPARIGLLDFQDAMMGPAEYDLASLVHDPRRDVSPMAVKAATEAYRSATGTPRDLLEARMAICTVQRSLRIIGRVFTRLCLHSGRTGYLRFIPPTWTALQRELRHPALADLRAELTPILPEPDARWLAEMRARAGTLRGRDHASTGA